VIQKLLTINFVIGNSMKAKLKVIGKLGCTLDIVQNPSMNREIKI
jgi:hypothetical protein